MKFDSPGRFLRHRGVLPALLALALLASGAATAAPTGGTAASAFEDARPTKDETAWGRLVADAIRDTAHADIALVDAGELQRGTLPAGPVDSDAISSLLAYPDDQVVIVTITGVQLLHAMERSVSVYPTGSAAWLDVSGLSATFMNVAPPSHLRLTGLLVGTREVRDDDSFTVAMPISLAKGGAGYYSIWTDAGAKSAKGTGVSLADSVAAYFKSNGSVKPDTRTRVVAMPPRFPTGAIPDLPR